MRLVSRSKACLFPGDCWAFDVELPRIYSTCAIVSDIDLAKEYGLAVIASRRNGATRACIVVCNHGRERLCVNPGDPIAWLETPEIAAWLDEIGD